MIRVAHVNDDPGIGGITRWLGFLMRGLGGRFAQDLVYARPTRLWALRLKADVIVLHFPPSWRNLPWRALLRLRNPRARVVAVEHSYTSAFEALHVPHPRRFRLMLRLAYGLADHVVSVSAGQAAWLREAAGLKPEALSVINPATDLSALRTLPAPRRDGPLRLCGYGRFTSQKGFDRLIEAMRLVPPELATLRLVGLGPDEAALRAQAADLAHVSVEGPVDGPEILLGEVDAVALPSRFEAFGIVAAEARAAARPVLLANVDGLTAQALPGCPELLVPGGDIARLAASIVWLAGQDLTALGLASRKTAEGLEERCFDAWTTLLAKLVPALQTAAPKPDHTVAFCQ